MRTSICAFSLQAVKACLAANGVGTDMSRTSATRSLPLYIHLSHVMHMHMYVSAWLACGPRAWAANNHRQTGRPTTSLTSLLALKLSTRHTALLSSLSTSTITLPADIRTSQSTQTSTHSEACRVWALLQACHTLQLAVHLTAGQRTAFICVLYRCTKHK